MRKRIVRASAAAGGLLALALALVASGCGSSSRSAAARHPQSPYRGATVVDAPHVPTFALRDQAGRLIGPTSFQRKFRIITFLYTHCPDVCPLIAANLNEALRELGAQRSQVRVLAISIDPRGDTPAAVRQFIASHRLLPQFRYLTGSARQLRPVWAKFAVAADPDRTDRAITHSAFEILIDRLGRERLFYDARVKALDVVHDLRLLMNAG